MPTTQQKAAKTAAKPEAEGQGRKTRRAPSRGKPAPRPNPARAKRPKYQGGGRGKAGYWRGLVTYLLEHDPRNRAAIRKALKMRNRAFNYGA